MREKLPEGLINIGEIMSNFDHSIKDESEEKLKNGGVCGGYAAWNFHASVWYDGKFKAKIMQFGSHTNTIESDSLQGIMDHACEYYGGK